MGRAEVAGQKALREHTFVAAPVSIPAARTFAADVLNSWLSPNRAADVGSCVSELATNVIRHNAETAHEFHVRLTRTDHTVRLEVEGDGAWRPAAQTSGPESASGRGLILVTAFSDGWGVELSPPSLIVWAEFKIGL